MKATIRHKLVLLVDDLIQLKASEDWEAVSTTAQDKNLKEIIDSLDLLYFEIRNQVIIES